MEFLAILIAWAAVQFWGSGGVVQQDAWLARWRGVLSGLGSSSLRLGLSIALPLAVLALLLGLFQGVLFGLIEFLLWTLVLLYSLGRGDFQILLRMYRNSWLHGDLAGAYHHGQSFSAELCESGADNALQLHHSVRRAILYQGFERWFVVVFWFVLLGPLPALAYRLLFLVLADGKTAQDERNLAAQLVFYLEWLPVRVLGFSFGLVGNFECCMVRLRKLAGTAQPALEVLDELAECAVPDIRQDSQVDGEQFTRDALLELDAIQNLLTRSLVAWIVVIALLQLI